MIAVSEEKIAEEKSPITIKEEEISKNKIILTVIGVIAAAAVFWMIGYFVVYPWLFSKEMPPVN